MNHFLAVWEKLKGNNKLESFKADLMEEFEDADGNVFNKKTYEGMFFRVC